jgi:hypothetical protein
MGKDVIETTLGHLAKADREAAQVINRLTRLLGGPAKAPPLRPCKIKVGKKPHFKTYTRKLTREQCALLHKGSSTPNAILKKLLKLQKRVSRAADLSWARLLAALTPPAMKKAGGTTLLGACDYTDLEGMGTCEPDMDQPTCDTLPNNHFRQGEGCGRLGR